MKQPDFQKLFFDYFGSVPRKVAYTVRQDSNRYHDLVFLSSLTHDARFKMAHVILSGQRLALAINRDCWELGIEHDGITGLYVADSALVISPVISLEWRTPHGCKMEEQEFWITSIWLSQSDDEELRDLVIEGLEWSCVVKLRDENIKIRLMDKVTPVLHSAVKNRKRTPPNLRSPLTFLKKV